VQLTYSALVQDNFGNFVPVEDVDDVEFFPDNRVFAFAKCSLATIQSDPECQGDAYFYSREVIIVATVNDGEQTSNSEVRFTVNFGPDCRNDYVTYNNVLLDITHYITQPATVDSFDPQISTQVANCPVTCSLTQVGGGAFPSPTIYDFDPATGAFKVSEQNFFNDKTSFDLELAC